jgi:hypothetical protein
MTKTRSLSLLCLPLLAWQLLASDPSSAEATAPPGTSAVAPSSSDDLNQLRERIAQQEEEIKKLQKAVDEQRALLERSLEKINAQPGATAPAVAGTEEVANAAPVKIVPAVNVAHPNIAMQKTETAPHSPLSISIGDTTFTPLGFVDATFYGRSTNLGSGIGTNFGALPFTNTAAGNLTEANFTTQNSRIGFRVDSTVFGGKVLGYFEADFLGNQPTNVFVSSNSDTFRMRNVFVDWQRSGFEVLAGQDWSMATPNRVGISPLPQDIFYTQDMDTNYQAGLVWSRQSQFRFIAHPSDNFAIGLSLENPQQYIGGSSGGSSVTLPVGLATAVGPQFDSGATSYSAPNLHPDIIVKAAYDGHVGDHQVMHVELVGIERSFKDSVLLPHAPAYESSKAAAVSGEANANLEVAKGFRLIANTFFGSGNGRYVFGQAPDVIVRPDGSISPIHTYSTVDGFELTLHKTLFYGYYGGIYIDRDVAIDTSTGAKAGSLIGYGFKGSTNNNRTIQEATFGMIQTLWKNPSYGALALITQYSYLTRNPWYVALGLPRQAQTNLYYVDLRYTLP